MRDNADTWEAVQKKGVNFVFWVTVFAITLFLSSCGTVEPVGMATEQASASKIGPETTVFVLPPQVVFEDIHTEAPLNASAYNGGLYETILKSTSMRMLRNKKTKTTDPDTLKKILASELVVEIQKKSPMLSTGRIDSESTTLLQSLASYDKNMALLVNYVDVKVGSRGTWDSNSGAITSQNSRSEFNAALFQCSTGQLLWNNKVLLRELPKRTSKRFEESLELLVMNFPNKEN